MTRRDGALALFAVAIVIAIASRLCASPARWSDPKTWGGAVPAAGSTVRIARGQTILLDTQPPALKGLIVEGRLIIADRDVRIEADGITVTGTFEAGSRRRPFHHKLDIVLNGASPEQGAFSVLNGGTIELFGLPKTAWLHVAATLEPGGRELLLERPAHWERGDRVAIAPSGYDVGETEERAVVAVDGPRVVLDAPVRYRHWGTVTDGIDERAEVGLLTHNVEIQSAADAPQSGIGGQVMVMRGGTLHASNVAFANLGQRGKLGRYPVHFHLAGDASGSFVEASSIVHSANRCLTIHGTNGVVVKDNVAYDTIGHCYFLEDGVEMGNVLEDNLGMLTRAAAQAAILESDKLPATFWISNPGNVLRGNVAAGSEGNGFWYNLSPHPTGPSATAAMWPRRTPLGEFSGNVAHTNGMNGLFVDILRNPKGVTEAPNYSPPVVADFETLTSYKNRRRGAWLRGTKLRLSHAAIADNSIGVTFAGADAFLRDSLVVGESENDTGPPKPFEADFPIRGFEFYDGQVGVIRTRFVNFVSNPSRRASALGALQFSPFFTDPSSFAQSLTFTNAEPVYFAKHAGIRDRLGADGYRGTVFRDAGGSVTGRPNASVVLDTPMLADADCERRPLWNALICDADYASLFIIGIDASANLPGPVRVARAEGSAYLTLYGNPAPGRDSIFQTNLRGERTYVVTFAHGFPAHVQIGLHRLAAGRGLTLVFPQAPSGSLVYEGRKAALGGRPRQGGQPLVIDLTEGNGGKQVLDICSSELCA
jgi:cell surface hyaluronidase